MPLNLKLQARSCPVFDEIRDVGANAAVGERRILFRHSRCDVLPLSLGEAECEPVDELPDRGIRVEAGQGRWDVQHHGSLLIAGQVWRTNDGFALMDWLDRPIGSFDSVEDALRFLLRSTLGRSLRQEAS